MLNAELERIWKEEAMAQLRYYPSIYVEGRTKNLKKKISARTASDSATI
jgi:hypothetical protein